MKDLLEVLRQQTQSLKSQYLEKTKEWAEKQYKVNSERRNKYFRSRPSDYTDKNDYYAEQKFAYNSPNWYFTVEFVERSMKQANQHYEDSLLKLVDRVSKKGLNKNKLEVKTSHIGVNIDTIVSDGEKTVHAFTILAWGDVQRPHYRYLIK